MGSSRHDVGDLSSHRPLQKAAVCYQHLLLSPHLPVFPVGTGFQRPAGVEIAGAVQLVKLSLTSVTDGSI